MNDYFNEQLYNERSDIFDFKKLDKLARIRECAPEMFELLKNIEEGIGFDSYPVQYIWRETMRLIKKIE